MNKYFILSSLLLPSFVMASVIHEVAIDINSYPNFKKATFLLAGPNRLEVEKAEKHTFKLEKPFPADSDVKLPFYQGRVDRNRQFVLQPDLGTRNTFASIIKAFIETELPGADIPGAGNEIEEIYKVCDRQFNKAKALNSKVRLVINASSYGLTVSFKKISS